LAHDEAC
jgi:hypothetical protein